MTSQLELLAEPVTPLPPGITESDQADLRACLMSHGWRTRRELCEHLGWEERKVRDVAETLGAEIVRCQLGFKLTANIDRDDLPAVHQAISAFHSQAAKMEHYANALRRRLHALIG